MAKIADPYVGLVSFQEGLAKGIIDLAPVRSHQDLYSHFDVPTPGTGRLTYVRLTDDKKTVKAFVSCIMNGEIEGYPPIFMPGRFNQHYFNLTSIWKM